MSEYRFWHELRRCYKVQMLKITCVVMLGLTEVMLSLMSLTHAFQLPPKTVSNHKLIVLA